MKLIVLIDNNTYIDKYYLGEPAVSYYIEDMGRKILFDTGYSDAFIKNALSLGIDVSDIDIIALSHGHNDHTGGLRQLINIDFNNKPELIAHPDALLFKKADGMGIGCPVSQAELEKVMKIKTSVKPVRLTKRLIFLGEIPIKNDFEERYSIGDTLKSGVEQKDFMLDDTALAYIGENVLYIITGCSHSGICNIISYAKEVTGIDKIGGVIGGLHLFDIDERAVRTIDYLIKENIPIMYPCHCTSFKVRSKLSNAVNIIEVGVGLELNWE